jgi:hypothetical protein
MKTCLSNWGNSFHAGIPLLLSLYKCQRLISVFEAQQSLYLKFKEACDGVNFTNIKEQCDVRKTGFIGSLARVAYYVN